VKTSTRNFLAACIAAGSALLLSSCESTSTAVATRKLPAYEPPLAKAGFQQVRTTAYTHTESDHLQFSNHNALGGRLQAASHGVQRAQVGGSLDSYLTPRKKTVVTYVKTKRGKKKVVKTVTVRPTIGSAAADWSRWPAGTYFRLINTGQIYKVDDYGWALSGRNTIDLYHANRAAMNDWGVRHEPIQILKWGDSQASLQVLQGRQSHKHIRRMVLELQGDHASAASLE
jgi:3D (Asp-Asp-Asp) domain-containing protein